MTTTSTPTAEPTTRASDVLEQRLQARLADAERVLESLEEARRETERHLADSNRADSLKSVTGRSALEAAIDTTRAIIEHLRRAIAETRRGFVPPAELLALDPAALAGVAMAR